MSLENRYNKLSDDVWGEETGASFTAQDGGLQASPKLGVPVVEVFRFLVGFHRLVFLRFFWVFSFVSWV